MDRSGTHGRRDGAAGDSAVTAPAYTRLAHLISRRLMMRRSLLTFGVITLVAVAVAADPPKKLGPEWTEDKETKEFFKMMQIKTVRSAGGNARNYYLDLEHDKVWVTDSDENIATSVHLNQTLSLRMRKDPKGATSNVTAIMNRCVHYDLNCDGAWDAWYDRRDGADKLYILHDGRWVRVIDVYGSFRAQGNDKVVATPDLKTDYAWDGKVWNAKPSKR